MTVNVLGRWTVQNPDQGQDLENDNVRLLVGGLYHFLAGGYVNIDLIFRDSAGQQHPEKWVGRFQVTDNDVIEIDYVAGPRERFRSEVNGQLLRESTTRPNVAEGSLILLRSS